MIQAAYNPLGKLRYNLKGVDPRHANEYGIRPAYQGELSGKRAGVTQNLSANARKASIHGTPTSTASGQRIRVSFRESEQASPRTSPRTLVRRRSTARQRVRHPASVSG